MQKPILLIPYGWAVSVGAAVLIGLFVFPPSASAGERVFCSDTGPNTSWCRIDEPNVRQRETEYEDIRFRSGDRVIVNAGGCVQTGGSGRTWKRYVNPSSDSDSYHGLIQLPRDATGRELVRIQDVIGRVLEVGPIYEPGDNWGDLNHLVLGYEDDDYGDNGYWGHDNGTADQCRGVGPAWVTLAIEHQDPNQADS